MLARMRSFDVARFLALTASLAAACAGGRPAPAPSPIVATAPTEVEVPDAAAQEDDRPDAGVGLASEPEGPAGEGDPSAEGSIAGDPLRGPADEHATLVPAPTGGMDPADIARVIRARVSKIRGCYQAELKNDPGFETKLTVRLVIGTNGAVSSASLTRPSGRQSFDVCVLGEVRRLRFPAPDGGAVTVSYPFVFKSA
ncbi:MAG: hypothetical protein AMXMBFR56_29100 [Polyangiaceae bacterium]